MQKSTRDKILDTAIELMWQQSYGSVSVDDICHVAKIQKGSFYHYFPSKIDVVIAAFEKLWQTSRPVFDSVFSAAVPPLERLHNYCELAYLRQKEKADKYGKVLGCPYTNCGGELSTLDERVRLKLDEMFTRSAKYFEALLRDAMVEGLAPIDDPAAVSQEMLSYVSGVMYQARLKNDVEIIRRDLEPGLLRYFGRREAPGKLPDRSVNRQPKRHEEEA